MLWGRPGSGSRTHFGFSCSFQHSPQMARTGLVPSWRAPRRGPGSVRVQPQAQGRWAALGASRAAGGAPVNFRSSSSAVFLSL